MGRFIHFGARTQAKVVFTSLALLVLVACGGGAEVGDDGPTATEDSPTVAETPEPQAADPLEELASAAAEEGTLTWYTAQVPDLVEATVAAFEKKYPDITVEALRLSSGPITTRYSEERATGIVPSDLITAAAPDFFETALEEGWLADAVDVPASSDWPSEFQRDGLFDVGIIPLTFAYNTDIVEESQIPTSWEDFLDEQWKGDIIFGDPRNVPAYMAQLELWRQTYGEQFLVDLGNQDLRIVESIVPGNQELAAGSAAFVIPNSSLAVAALLAEGAPIGEGMLEPMTGVEWTTAISADAESPNAARLFLNYLLTEEGQTVFNGVGAASPLGDVGETVPLPDGYAPLVPLLEAADEEQLLELMGIG